MQDFVYIINLVTPVFLIVGLGYFLKRIRIITDNFVSLSSKIVFNVSLPALIFVEISKLDFSKVLDPALILFACTTTIIVMVLVWLVSNFIKEGRNRAVFIQGSFRSNFAIIGLAIIANVFGSSALGKASLVLAFILPLYNIVSVMALTIPVRKEKRLNFTGTFLEILRNPLILGVLAGLPFSYFHIHIYPMFQRTVDYLAALSLPLALLGIGGFLSFHDLKKPSPIAFSTSLIKIIIVPFAATFIAFLMGFKGDDLGILFILFACPTAVASFIMAEAMGVNGKLAGNIVLITTLGSILTITLGLFILRQNGLI